MSAGKRTYAQRITRANLRDLPSALDTEQASAATGMSIERVRTMTADPFDPEQMADPLRLHHLAYTRDFLYSQAEVRRFMRAWTVTPQEVRS